ncbi:alpha/beta hydrolase [Catenovulum sp. SM1970]|uniref:alpha/beta fold hydrolase n=1 Tax=Marinifaba aquimaris TaxID=2741323 RepID=UPI001572908A|nr:alpha/beta hydrolase [Marinifaba aquimaris]NTS76457.1 alpha/beta hydrolase [Marinifaba aquimaris]
MELSNERPVLLIRGLLRNQYHWGDFPKQLSIQLKRRVICLDIPGNGHQYREDSPSSISAMRQSLSVQLDGQLPKQQSVDVVAISMGGMIALEWAQAEPKRIQSLCLINTSLKQFSPFYQRLNWQCYPLVTVFLFLSKIKKEHMVFKLTSNINDKYVRQDTINHWLAIAKQFPVRTVNAFRQLFAAASSPIIKKPQQKCILLVSENDQLVSAKCSKAIAQFWSLPILLNDKAGHDMALDDADFVITALRSWFDSKC